MRPKEWWKDWSITVSQFTLLASTKKGNKPDFHKSAPAAKGKELYDCFIGKVRSLYQEDRVKDGVFQAMMDVALVNDGPVGVDYRCEDEAVYARQRAFVRLFQHAPGWCLRKVTIEIDTSPPKMENPSGLEAPTEFDTFKGHVHKKFDLPASLLEWTAFSKSTI